MNWLYVLTSFDGRIARQQFWQALIPVLMFEIIAQVIAHQMGGERLGAIVDLAFAYPEFAIFAKRGHDRNIPTMWIGALFAVSVFMDFLIVLGVGGSRENPSGFMMILLVPWMVIALALLIDLGFRRGTSGPNAYGPDPLAGGAS